MDARDTFPKLVKAATPAPTNRALAVTFGEAVPVLSTVPAASSRVHSTGLLATAFAACARTQPLGLSTGFWGILLGTYITSTTPAEAVNLYDYSALTTLREALVVATASGWWGPHYGSVFQPGPLLEWHQSLVDVPLLFLVTYVVLALVVAGIERAWTRIAAWSPLSWSCRAWSTVRSQLVASFSHVVATSPTLRRKSCSGLCSCGCKRGDGRIVPLLPAARVLAPVCPSRMDASAPTDSAQGAARLASRQGAVSWHRISATPPCMYPAPAQVACAFVCLVLLVFLLRFCCFVFPHPAMQLARFRDSRHAFVRLGNQQTK
ncbi:hypothetical protein AMAG_01485 [Allomyces macrogynus ATCC 38327]|uniref:Uncharacterized protein n=1 Tax=Allomyces macrogynus (strain ATCC 38327) TaxID=578462 RepID=A0A0L0RZV5_ALLM3|nr:hypothetical protein AMAG_01485 [Allomyces macrogynus ATCC 38327]|eukprot:KNE55594.1 hypothetical protein AMAG_01485 [Allomyces macrogynus ATCC 38327]